MMDAEAIMSTLVEHAIIVEGASPVPLLGGVSCNVWRVAPGDVAVPRRVDNPNGLVIKAPLAQLRVPTVWEADVSRGFAETQALILYGQITPDSVPRVVWHDRTRPVLVMECAPPNWQEWREQLSTRDSQDACLVEDRIAGICGALGQTLATWHVHTQDLTALPPELASGDRLRTLRTDPFHRATAIEMPAVASVLTQLAQELEGQKTCLVHGDFSPKNFLVAPPSSMRVWILDAEVAHIGNPALDVAFLSAHLILKAILRPDLVNRLDAGRRAFHQAYRHLSLLVDERGWRQHTGAILGARVRGVSRVTYLNEDQQAWVLGQAEDLLLERIDLDDVWRAILGH
jgi:hypothetical protein